MIANLELGSGRGRPLGAAGVDGWEHDTNSLALAGAHDLLVELEQLILVLVQQVVSGVQDLSGVVNQDERAVGQLGGSLLAGNGTGEVGVPIENLGDLLQETSLSAGGQGNLLIQEGHNAVGFLQRRGGGDRESVACAISRIEEGKRVFYVLNQVANVLVVEVFNWSPLDAFTNIFLLLFLDGWKWEEQRRKEEEKNQLDSNNCRGRIPAENRMISERCKKTEPSR